MDVNETVIDTKLINKFALHKLAANGGSVKLNNRFGLRVVYNENNPNSPMVELRVFVIPLGTIYKGNINPSLARTTKKKEKKVDITVTEDAEIIM